MSTRTTTTYSHNGCSRCKRMKIKCDEKRPNCGACDRKKTECVYEFPFVIYNPHSSKKRKNKSGKVSKSGSGDSYKINQEDRRILQITLPSEFKFIAEKFSDDSSSPSSITSPPANDSQTYCEKNFSETNSSPLSSQLTKAAATGSIAASFNSTSSPSASTPTMPPGSFPSSFSLANQKYDQLKNHTGNLETSFKDHFKLSDIPVKMEPQQTFDWQQVPIDSTAAVVTTPSSIAATPNTNSDNTNTAIIPQFIPTTSMAPAIPHQQDYAPIDYKMWNNFMTETDYILNLSMPQETVDINRPQPLPQFKYDFYKSNTMNYMVQYLNIAQPIIESRHLTADDPEIRDLLWNYFISGKALSNHLFVEDDFANNPLIDWLKILSRNNIESHNTIFTSIIATSANGIALQTNVDYWAVIREKYMDMTLAMLSENINVINSFVTTTCLLFTVLLLYSEKSATDSPVWRLHLKGALGILRKINSIWNMVEVHAIENKSEELKAAINLFHFCECWFLSAESLAWISSLNGGSMPCLVPKDLTDARQLLSNHLPYENQNALVLDGFNTVRFYSQNLVEVMNEIVLHIMTLKINHDINISDIRGLLLNTPPTEESLKLGERLISKISDICTYDEHFSMKFENCHDKLLAKTMKTAAECYVMGIQCFIYSSFMGYNIYCPEIQILIQKFINKYDQMPYDGPCAISVHWPCFILACCTPNDPNLRSRILKPLYNMIHHSMFGASFSIKRVQEIWNFFDSGAKDSDRIAKIDTICF
ncbi:hypothetical protein DASC09_039400 [Saccharomycopsis crataegensis]|uniref:Zn(2)-C6 fungal-type domain-containing protein n=1 Tax=Saccharomycopsis crataegensis TaxID=43959 RepID=A0AAV5QQ00_9ASCO|nr:hypothetical protein DASC09_039400 [Saccharomycopsis crataegensis]